MFVNRAHRLSMSHQIVFLEKRPDSGVVWGSILTNKISNVGNNFRFLERLKIDSCSGRYHKSVTSYPQIKCIFIKSDKIIIRPWESDLRRTRNYLFVHRPWIITLIGNFLVPSPSALSEKKSKNITCDVTVGTKKIKLHVQIECHWCYIMIQISNGICRYEGKFAALDKNICHFGDRHRARFPGKNPKAKKHITIDSMLRSGIIFRKNTLGDGPTVRFFPRFTDKG